MIFLSLLLLGCQKKVNNDFSTKELSEEDNNLSKINYNFVLQNEDNLILNEVNEDNEDIIKQQDKETIKCLTTEILQSISIEKIESFSCLYENLSNKYSEIENINTIWIENYLIESFDGINLFTNLAIIDLRNCVIYDLENLIIVKDFGNSPVAPALYLENCTIMNFSNISYIPLKELSVSSYDFSNTSDCLFPSTLRTLHLAACNNILYCFNRPYEELISLNLGRVELTEDEIKTILKKCPNLEYLYLDEKYFNNDICIFDFSYMKKLRYVGKESSAYS